MVRAKYKPLHYPTGIKRGDNCKQAVAAFMTHAHPVSGLFVIEALHKFADQVLKDQDQLRKDMKNHIIAPDYWIAMAKAWKEGDEFRTKKDDKQ